MQNAFYNVDLRDECKAEYVLRRRNARKRAREVEMENEIRRKVMAEWLKKN